MTDQADRKSLGFDHGEIGELIAIAGFLTQCLPGRSLSAGLFNVTRIPGSTPHPCLLLKGVVRSNGLETADPHPCGMLLGDPTQGHATGSGRYQMQHFAGRAGAVSALCVLGHAPAMALMEKQFRTGPGFSPSASSRSGPPEPTGALPDVLRECLRLVPKGGSGRPIWPAGFVGSITHAGSGAGSVAAALVAPGDDVLIGIDCEAWLSQRRAETVAHRILNATERAVIRAGSGFDDERAVTLAFSVKESVFKALFPVASHAFGFDAVRVESVVGASVTLKIVDPRLSTLKLWPIRCSVKRLVAQYFPTADSVWVALVHPVAASAHSLSRSTPSSAV